MAQKAEADTAAAAARAQRVEAEAAAAAAQAAAEAAEAADKQRREDALRRQKAQENRDARAEQQKQKTEAHKKSVAEAQAKRREAAEATAKVMEDEAAALKEFIAAHTAQANAPAAMASAQPEGQAGPAPAPAAAAPSDTRVTRSSAAVAGPAAGGAASRVGGKSGRSQVTPAQPTPAHSHADKRQLKDQEHVGEDDTTRLLINLLDRRFIISLPPDTDPVSLKAEGAVTILKSNLQRVAVLGMQHDLLPQMDEEEVRGLCETVGRAMRSEKTQICPAKFESRTILAWVQQGVISPPGPGYGELLAMMRRAAPSQPCNKKLLFDEGKMGSPSPSPGPAASR
jgi:hypothetical protein